MTFAVFRTSLARHAVAGPMVGRRSLEAGQIEDACSVLLLFVAVITEAGPIDALKLPSDAAVICYYREDAFHLAGPDDALRNGDEVVILTSAERLPELKHRWEPRQGGEEI